MLRPTRVFGLAVILALAGVGCGTAGQLGAKALSQQLKALQSEAAEGALLAQDAASGMTTSTYTREHSLELSSAASQAEATLRAASTGPALEPELRQLLVLAGRVSSGLQRLATATTDETGVLARELRANQKFAEGLA